MHALIFSHFEMCLQISRKGLSENLLVVKALLPQKFETALVMAAGIERNASAASGDCGGQGARWRVWESWRR